MALLVRMIRLFLVPYLVPEQVRRWGEERKERRKIDSVEIGREAQGWRFGNKGKRGRNDEE